MRRFLKQFIYGLLFASVFSLAAYAAFVLFIKPSPTCFDRIQNQNEEKVDCGGVCAPCFLAEVKHLKYSTQFFEAPGGTSLYLEVRNDNQNLAADYFFYRVNLLDPSGRAITEETGESFIYAGETKQIILPGLATPLKSIGRAEVLFQNISWKPADKFPKPNVSVAKVGYDISKDSAIVRGTVENKELFPVREATINVLLVGKPGLFFNVSRTVVNNLAPQSARDFKVFIPVTQAEVGMIDFEKTKIFVAAKR